LKAAQKGGGEKFQGFPKRKDPEHKEERRGRICEKKKREFPGERGKENPDEPPATREFVTAGRFSGLASKKNDSV